jgi:hypothetical protein
VAFGSLRPPRQHGGLLARPRRQRAGTLFYDRPKEEWERTASGMLRIDQEECDVTGLLPRLLYSPSLGG